MSANNWAQCPICYLATLKEREASKKLANDSYGKVPPDEYRRLYAQANPTVKLVQFTLKESYEIGIFNGTFQVRYSANCVQCGFEYTRNYEEVIPALRWVAEENDHVS